MTVARLVALVAVGLLTFGAGSAWLWTPTRLRKPYLSQGPLGSPWYFVWSTALLSVATIVVFAEGRIALAFAFLGVTAASGGLWLYRSRGGR